MYDYSCDGLTAIRILQIVYLDLDPYSVVCVRVKVCFWSTTHAMTAYSHIQFLHLSSSLILIVIVLYCYTHTHTHSYIASNSKIL